MAQDHTAVSVCAGLSADGSRAAWRLLYRLHYKIDLHGLIDMENKLMVTRSGRRGEAGGIEGLGEKGEGIEKYEL